MNIFEIKLRKIYKKIENSKLKIIKKKWFIISNKKICRKNYSFHLFKNLYNSKIYITVPKIPVLVQHLFNLFLID